MATLDIKSILNAIRVKILGEDNIYLIHFIDKFYSYKERKRKKVIVYSTLIILSALGLVSFLFINTNVKLQKQLQLAVASQTFLENKSKQYQATENQYQTLQAELAKTNKKLNLVSVVNDQIESLGIEQFQVSNNAVQETLPPEHALADEFSKEYIQVSLTNISLKQTLIFVEELEKLPQKLKVETFSIKPWDAERLYFDVTMKVSAYVPGKAGDAGHP